MTRREHEKSFVSGDVLFLDLSAGYGYAFRLWNHLVYVHDSVYMLYLKKIFFKYLTSKVLALYHFVENAAVLKL